MQADSLEQQVWVIIRALEGKKYERDSPVFRKALEWIERWPKSVGEVPKRRLLGAISACFAITEAEVYRLLATGVIPQLPQELQTPTEPTNDELLRKILPGGGWFEWYDAHTQFTEPPLSYHIFCSLCALGAALGRRIYLNMGFFNVYPNCAIILVGPPGKVHKTEASNIARGFVERLALCPIMADKITPESLATALNKYGGHQVIMASELAVFFGRQKYNEGLSTLMLKLLDSPNTLTFSTQARGEETVENLAITLIGATTPSLLASSTSQEVTSSGFLSRLLLITENDTPRCFTMPRKGPYGDKLEEQLKRLRDLAGEMRLSVDAHEWHETWYRTLWKELREIHNETAAEVKARSQIHMLRFAMLTHLVQCDSFEICVECMQVGAGLVKFLDRSIDQTVRNLRQSTISQDAELCFDVLSRMGGAADHSSLLRRVSSRMNATQFKQHMRTLEESGRVQAVKKGIAAYYVITGIESEDTHQ